MGWSREISDFFLINRIVCDWMSKLFSNKLKYLIVLINRES